MASGQRDCPILARIFSQGDYVRVWQRIQRRYRDER